MVQCSTSGIAPRRDARGKLKIVYDHPRVGEAELVAGAELHRGLVRVSLRVLEDVEPG
jgi:hypothetical protein